MLPVSKLWNFFKDHGRFSLEIVAIMTALLVGRCTARPRVVTTLDVTETKRLQEKIASLMEINETWKASFDQRLEEAVRQKTAEIRRNRVVITTKPDGTRIEDRSSSTTKTDEQEASKTADQQAATAGAVAARTEATATVDATADRHETRQAVVPEAQPRLMLGLSVGASVPALLGRTPDRQILPFVPHVLMGTLSLDTRLFGPLWGGVWGSTTGAAGITLRWAIR